MNRLPETRLTPKQKAAIAEAALQVIDDAIREDNFDVAKQMGSQASQLVRSSKDRQLLKEVAAKNKEVEATARVYADAQGAMATLKEEPGEPGTI